MGSTFKVASVSASPVFMDLDATIEKAVTIIADAASQGAELVAFPEVFVPGFPYWVFLDSPMKHSHLYRLLYKNSLDVTSYHMRKIQETAKMHGIAVSLGFNEVTERQFGTIWNTNVLINEYGNIVSRHRKLVPTFAEKLVWAYGDGNGMGVYRLNGMNVGALICGENTNTLARFALLAQGEQVHVASYPAYPFRMDFSERYDIIEAIRIRSASHSFEGKVFNIVSTQVITPAVVELLADTPEKHAILTETGVSFAGVFGPSGRCISEELIDTEGLIVTEINLDAMIEAKQLHDIVGGYNRFDVFKLQFNRTSTTDPIHTIGNDFTREFYEPDGEEFSDFKFTHEEIPYFATKRASDANN